MMRVDTKAMKRNQRQSMRMAWRACSNMLAEALKPDGELVIVFAHKHPDAWETLVSAIIRAGFTWMAVGRSRQKWRNRMRALSSAALASSVWLVCKKRPATARPGWDNQVLEEMRQNIRAEAPRVLGCGDPRAGLRLGGDRSGAGGLQQASGGEEGQRARAGDGRVGVPHPCPPDGGGLRGRPGALRRRSHGEPRRLQPTKLDEPTAYYLLHRHDFGMDEAPAGACILYAISCGISDKELAGTWDLIGFTKGKSAEEDDEDRRRADADAEADAETDEDSGSKVKLKTWVQRKGRSLGYEGAGRKPVPLIDRVHCLMHLWKAGDLSKVDEYLDENGLRRQELFKRLLQSLIELSPHGSEERSLLESSEQSCGRKRSHDG